MYHRHNIIKLFLSFFFQYYAMTEKFKVDENYSRLQNSKYYRFAREWLQIFPREQIHFVNGDTITRDPVSELRKIETFLGLRHYISQSNFVFNSTKGFFCWRYSDGTETCETKNKGRPHPKIARLHLHSARRLPQSGHR